jgi:hypothetical protein
MAELGTITLCGYAFNIYKRETEFTEFGAIYVMAKPSKPNASL